jgi:broad specificity phosphatase PhoE
MMYPLVYLVRHGQTDWNAEHRLQGQADVDLNEVGRRQAARNGLKLGELIADPAGFDFVASPMRRTRETMELVRKAMGLPTLAYRTDPRLVEVHFGDWQGHTLAELDLKNPGTTAARDLDKWNFVPPGEGAESYAMLHRRVAPWFDELTRPTVCVTHGGIFRVLFRIAGRKPIKEAAALDIAQDRVLCFENGKLDWV